LVLPDGAGTAPSSRCSVTVVATGQEVARPAARPPAHLRPADLVARPTRRPAWYRADSDPWWAALFGCSTTTRPRPDVASGRGDRRSRRWRAGSPTWGRAADVLPDRLG
jgi:hypothetical protein